MNTISSETPQKRYLDVRGRLINAEPGAILIGPQREFCRRWKNQEEVTIRGSHFIQEDSPHEIGRAIADFVRRIGR